MCDRMKKMVILGLDPGTATTGYGVIKVHPRGLKLIKFGWISTDKNLDSNLRLRSIYHQMIKLLEEFNPDVVAIERLFFYNNAKTAMKVSEAMGVLRLAVVEKNIKIVEYAPLKIKSVVTQNGWAKKEEMKKVVKKILNFRIPPKKKTHFDDAADALGVAICHAKILEKERARENRRNAGGRSNSSF